MNEKINWFDVFADFISGILVGIVGFAAFFFVLNLADLLFPTVKSITPVYLRGVALGMWLGANTFQKNNIFVTSLSISVILLTLGYNAIVTKIIALQFSSFDVTIFINSFVIGIIIITSAKLAIKRKKTEPTEKIPAIK